MMTGPPVDDPDDEPSTDTISDSGSQPNTSNENTHRDHSDPTQSSNSHRMSDSDTDASNSNDRDVGLLRWFFRTDQESVVLVRDVLSSVILVVLIGLILFGVSGVWPPLVAVESGSMEPHMERGDLILIVDQSRFSGDNPVGGTGIVTYETGHHTGHERFGKPGDVIIFSPNGDATQTPVIHRAHFWVEEGENWADTRANQEYVGNSPCSQIDTCPARHDGFITKGDDNAGYDQLSGSGTTTDVVKSEWVSAKGVVRIPWLGHIRLAFDSILSAHVDTPPIDDPTVADGDLIPADDIVNHLELGILLGAITLCHSRRPGHW